MDARVNLFQVVTFATDPLHGNPAFVLSGARGLSDDVLISACNILRADVVAVLDEDDGGVTPLRFFTGKGPHGGAGHATLAAAHVALRNGLARRAVTLHTSNGDRRAVEAEGERIAVDFPVMPASRVGRIADMERRWARDRPKPGSRPSAMSRSMTIPPPWPG